MKKVFKKMFSLLALFGPGLFIIGYNMGTGSITTMSKSGADYGMGLFWVLVLASIFTYVMMVAYSKVTLVTGRTAMYNVKTHFKHGWILQCISSLRSSLANCLPFLV